VPRPLHITIRVLALLGYLAQFRLASVDQLAALDGGSGQNVSRALLVLWEHGYVERLLGQLESRFLYKGSFPLIYGLTRTGVWLLHQHGFDVRRRLLYETDKQRNAGWRFIEHRVGITEFMVRLELACRDRQDVSLLTRKDILADAPKTQRDRRVRLSTKVRIDGDLKQQSVDPDELFGLRFVHARHDSYFMFECDRGEMPIVRHKSKEQTYYARKMLIYHQANRQGVHSRDLGIPNFRIATVTTTAGRVEQMIAAQREITNGKGSNMFLFTDEATFAAGNPLHIEWRSGKGECVRLTD
jgi:DNA-binding transcriptional ArsR family regulator